MKRYIVLAGLLIAVALYERYMIAVILITLAITATTIYLFNRSVPRLRKRVPNGNHIVHIVLVNFIALCISGVILMFSSYLAQLLNTEVLGITKPIHANSAPILGLWVPLVFVANYFFFVFLMTSQLLERKAE